jgi:hypothetical protein
VKKQPATSSTFDMACGRMAGHAIAQYHCTDQYAKALVRDGFRPPPYRFRTFAPILFRGLSYIKHCR